MRLPHRLPGHLGVEAESPPEPPAPPAPAARRSVNGGLPQCAAPFTITRQGTLTVEQGSVAANAAHVYNVAVCPQGFRDDLPEYGVPSLLWLNMPLDLTALEQALHQWEPEANLELEEQRSAIAQAQITIAVE